MNCISISFKNAHIDFRERFSFSEEEKRRFEEKAISAGAKSCVVVSTCNRSEIYFTGDERVLDGMQTLLTQEKRVKEEDFKKAVGIYSGDMAAYHLFKVACGMDSMVLGEDEILRQVKEAYQCALARGRCDYECNIFFQEALHVAKAVKTDTKISKTPVSIATLTAHSVFEFLEGKEGGAVLLVGAYGKIGAAVGRNIMENQGIRLLATSRSHRGREEIFGSRPNVACVPYERRYDYLDEADVIISATASPHYTFTGDETMKFLKRKKSRLFVDLAVPRDIDGKIGGIGGIKLLQIDDFRELSRANNAVKIREMEKAQGYIQEGMEEAKKSLAYHRFSREKERLEALAAKKGVPYLFYQLRDRMSGDELISLVEGLEEIMGEQ